MARGGRRRVDYTWLASSDIIPLAAGAVGVRAISSTFGAASTLFRVRGEMMLTLDDAAIGEAVALAAGLIIATGEALTAGAASLPNPDTDGGADWLWHGYLLAMVQAQSNDNEGAVARLTIDSKAMRKVKAGQQLGLIVNAENLAGTPACDVVYGIRALFGD